MRGFDADFLCNLAFETDFAVSSVEAAFGSL
jgi:hypothetical protein